MKDSDLQQVDPALTGAPSSPNNRESIRRWAFGSLALGLIVYAYGISRVCLFQVTPVSLLEWLWVFWGQPGGDYAHGYLVPIMAGIVFWWQWSKSLRHIPALPTNWGLLVISGAMLLYAVGVRGEAPRIVAESLVILVFGMVLYLGGWGWAKESWFACGFLVFMIPFNDTRISFELRMFVTKIAVLFLNTVGLDVFRQGSGIYSRAGHFLPLDVADPCSGIRSLVALMALTSMYGHLTMDRAWKKWVLFLASLPLAVIGNLARITTVALVAQGFGSDSAMKIYHEFSGYIVFSLAILCMLGLGVLLNLHYRELIDHWRQEEAPLPRSPVKTSERSRRR